ncbi:hypothetical protein HPB50_021138 [Hyalomma asiaticum]|uniref:Uncharacterized protein n=1 Tax=Hyalomma asiaticum TaxID=266040 RepID=A0ACB7TJM9_HYAAI|nr:hypothetical protein HPB50_021138 [Hyalomma asiaticum]
MDAYGAGGRESAVSLTCPACRISAVSTRARAMCPFCGSFYNRDANSNTSLRRRTAPGDSLPHIDSQRPLVRVTGFGPLITDSLGAIHAYITGLILRPPSPTTLYSSLPPVQHDAERRLCTQSAGSPPEPAKDTGSVYGREQLLPEPEYPVRRKDIRELRQVIHLGKHLVLSE